MVYQAQKGPKERKVSRELQEILESQDDLEILESMVLLDLMDPKETVVPMGQLEALDLRAPLALQETEESKDLLDLVENQD